MRKYFFLLFKLVIFFAIFVWILKSVNINEAITLLKKTNLLYFLLAYLLNNLSNIFLTIKWHRLATPLGIKSSFLELLQLNYISTFYSIFIPGQASGELIKGLKLTKKEDSNQTVWIPIFIDKITNVLIVFLIGLIAVMYDNNFKNNISLIVLLSAITISLFLLTLVLFSENAAKIADLIKSKLMGCLTFFKLNTSFMSNFSLTYFEGYRKSKTILLETLFWSLLTKIPHIFSFYLLALSLSINLDIVQSACLFSLVSVTSLLPISFSGLGVREGTVIVLLSQLGISNSSALSLSMLIFITGILIGLLGGVLELFSGLKPQVQPNK